MKIKKLQKKDHIASQNNVRNKPIWLKKKPKAITTTQSVSPSNKSRSISPSKNIEDICKERIGFSFQKDKIESIVSPYLFISLERENWSLSLYCHQIS